MKINKLAFTCIIILTVYVNALAQVSGACLDFNGSNNYAYRPFLDLGSKKTIQAKVFSRNLSPFGVKGIIVYNGTVGSTGYGLALNRSTDEVVILTGGITTPTGYTLSPSAWKLLTLEIDSVSSVAPYFRFTLYVDQIPVLTSYPLNYNIVSGSDKFIVGGDGSGQGFIGQIDEVRIWDTLLTQCQIIRYLDCEIYPRPARLVDYYTLNQGVASAPNPSETVVYDMVAPNNMTLSPSFSLTGSSSNWVAPGAITPGYITTAPKVTASVTEDTLCLGMTTKFMGGGISGTYVWTDGVVDNTTFTPTIVGYHSYTVTGTDALGCKNTAAVAVRTSSITPKLTVIKDPEYSSTTISIPDGQTEYQILGVKLYEPYKVTFTDPMPPDAVIVGVDVSYEGHDQGFRDSGFQPCAMFVENELIATNVLDSPDLEFFPYTYTRNAFFSNYNYGGSNEFRLEFDGRPYWQASIQNTKITFRYKFKQQPIVNCKDSLATLQAFGAVETYTWSGGIANNLPFPLTTSQIYTVTATNLFGCKNTETLSVTVDSPTLTANSGSICSGESFTIVPTGGVTYTFSSGSNIVVPTSITNSYTVTGRSSAGCTASAVSTVIIDCVLKTYSGITPNGDGLNDVWVIDDILKYPKNKVTIFNRWGNKLFDSAGYDNKTIFWPENNANLTSGTYFYVVDLGDDSKPMKGWIELIKN